MMAAAAARMAPAPARAREVGRAPELRAAVGDWVMVLVILAGATDAETAPEVRVTTASEADEADEACDCAGAEAATTIVEVERRGAASAALEPWESDTGLLEGWV